MTRSEENRIYFIDGVRTPFGRHGGVLSDHGSVDLGAMALSELVRRQPSARAVDGALLGVVLQAGLGQNPARTAVVRAGLPMTTYGATLNSVCLASLDTVANAARRIRLGEGHGFLVGGFESTSNAPAVTLPDGTTVGITEHDGLGCTLSGLSMGALSERENAELGLSREDQDAYARRSHDRASGYAEHAEDVMDVEGNAGAFRADECVRRGTTLAALARLEPSFDPKGTITAGNSSKLSDGAAVGLVGDTPFAEQCSGEPLARIVDWVDVAGVDPTLHLRPAEATCRLLERNGMRTTDVDLYEINEAFAGVVLASIRALGLSESVVNVRGGAIALGHPFGATGFRLLLTLAHELRRRDCRRGIATLCGGGGQGVAVLIERC